ncbi:hypothetical protein ACLESO_21565 [Pyxidicoccus sp. 3LG]
MKKSFLLMPSTALLAIVAGAIALNCRTAAPKPEQLESTLPLGATSTFAPVPLPDPGVAGYRFPEPEEVIVGWTQANDQKAINTHAWGLWTALTLETKEVYENQPLRVFETWVTPQDIQDLGEKALQATPRNPRRFTPFNQFRLHAKSRELQMAGNGQETVTGFVKYDPSAAQHITSNNLFSQSNLCSMLQAGQTQVPNFPNTAVSLKPVFQTLSAGSLVNGRYYMLANWPGTPGQPKPFPSTDWGQCIWVDIQDTSSAPGSGQVDTTCNPNGSSRTAATTYGVGQFIHFQLEAQTAQRINALRASAGAKAAPVNGGDFAILVAMHVTSREMTRWTWQTYWWVPNPSSPLAPSSAEIAALRPPQLTGAAANYAHCNAYSMLQPPQPNTGGKNVGAPVYCFNPWLEAGFGPSDLPDSEPLEYGGQTLANNVGVQTNCMSCHAQANFPEPKSHGQAPCLTNQDPPAYTGDRYVDLDSPDFKGTLKVDFLWSIADTAK